MKNFSIVFASIVDQVYLIPTVKVTHDRFLNGNLEILFCWLKWEIGVAF